MSINVIQSSSIELLLEALQRQTDHPAKDLTSVLGTQHFIVPNRGIEKWLSQKIAERTGVSANFKYFNRIQAFQWFAYQQVVQDKEKVRKANMPRIIIKWRLYEALKPLLRPAKIQISRDHALFSLIANIYENSSSLTDEAEAFDKRCHSLYWVVEQVAKLFLNYIEYRAKCGLHLENCSCGADWLSSWCKDIPLDVERLTNKTGTIADTYTLHQAQDIELWQRYLWVNYLKDDFELSMEIDADFWNALESPLTQKSALKKIPSELIVFTVLDLPPHQLNFLRRIGQYINVVIYHFNPSQEYWADSVDSRWKKQYDLEIKKRFIEKSKQNGKEVKDADIEKFFNNFAINFNAELRESRHPLLTRLGKKSRDNFSLLSTLSSGDEGEWFDLFHDVQNDTLLGKLQSDILNLLEPEKGSYTLRADDKSIQFNACHSSLRQVEILKEQIIHWLSQGTADNPRKPDDVLVLTPNIRSIEPLVRSVFSSVSKSSSDIYVPVKLTGVPQMGISNAWNSVMGRIKLTRGRFRYDEFADWLMLSTTRKLYGLRYSQVERILKLLKLAKFKRGFDDEHLKSSLAEGDDDYRFSFKATIDRLTLGVAIDEHEWFSDTLSFEGVLPSDYELVCVLLTIYKDLNERRDWLCADSMQTTPEEWLIRIGAEISQFQDAGELNLAVVSKVITGLIKPLSLGRYYDLLGNKSEASLVNLALPLNYILDEIQKGIDGLLEIAEPSGQVTIAQVGAIRPIPFKLIVMLDMDMGVFPSNQNNTPFDLMRLLKQQIGDRSRLDDEQGAFLDALLLAEQNFWVFYNGFDLNGGYRRQPSSVVQELIDHLAFITQPDLSLSLANYIDYNGVDVPEHIIDIYQVHTLQPFDVKSFTAKSNRFKNHWYSVAQNILNSEKKYEGWSTGVYLSESGQDVIPASRWVSDVTFPAQLYLSSLNIKNITPDDVIPDYEPLVLAGLDRYALRDFLQKNDTEDQALALDKLPAGKLKSCVWEASIAEKKSIQERLLAFAPKPTKTKTKILDLDGQIKLSILVPEDDSVTQWVSLKSSSAYAEHRAKAWLEYLLWIASLDLGDKGHERESIVVFSNKDVQHKGVSSDQAKDLLRVWVEMWRFGQREPLVLPAKLLLAPIESGKRLDWYQDPETDLTLCADLEVLVKNWNETYQFSDDFPLSENRSNKKHRDWSYILRGRESEKLLREAIHTFAYKAYAPIYQYQTTLGD